jgi:lysophospholipase L1-like esterase
MRGGRDTVSRRSRARGLAFVAAAVAVLALAGCRWQATWIRSQGPLLTPTTRTDQSLRVIAYVQTGSILSRVRLQNTFGPSQSADGNAPITIGAATLARRTSGAAVDSGSIEKLTFSGRSTVTIAPGGSVVSDPVSMPLASGTDAAISLFLPGSTVPAGHTFGFVTHYSTPDGAGDHTRDASGAAFSSTGSSTLIASAIESLAPDQAQGSVVAIGGSIVDGAGSTRDGRNTFPDQLADRVASELPIAQRMPVLNAGLVGTTASAACPSRAFGPSVQERLQRDSLSLAHVSRVIIWAGTNDLANGCTGDQIIAALADIAQQVHAAGSQVLISTISPRASYTEAQNLYRAQVNAWVRTQGTCSAHCDHALDFDAVLRDPDQPNRIRPALDSGDGVHPNPTGYGLVADSVPLADLVDTGPAPPNQKGLR